MYLFENWSLYFKLSAVPRFRNSIIGTFTEACRNVKRPHSVISMSSVSSSSTSSGGTSNNGTHSIGLAYDTNCENIKPFNRSATLNSQCSVGKFICNKLRNITTTFLLFPETIIFMGYIEHNNIKKVIKEVPRYRFWLCVLFCVFLPLPRIYYCEDDRFINLL